MDEEKDKTISKEAETITCPTNNYFKGKQIHLSSHKLELLNESKHKIKEYSIKKQLILD